MKKFYLSVLILITILGSERAIAQMPCYARFYLDTVASSPFNAVIVNNSLTSLTPPDSALYFWSFGDGTSSTAKYPTHTYTSPGAKYIYLVVTNVNKTCKDSMLKMIRIDSLGGFHKRNGEYTIRVVSPTASGIAEVITEGFVTLIPNIITDEAKFTFNGLVKNTPVQIEIFSYTGKNVFSSHELLSGNTLQVQTAALQSGMYFALIKVENRNVVIKFSKQ